MGPLPMTTLSRVFSCVGAVQTRWSLPPRFVERRPIAKFASVLRLTLMLFEEMVNAKVEIGLDPLHCGRLQ